MRRRALAAIVLAVAGACAGGPPRPVEIDTRNDACAHCRMIVSDVRLAAEIVRSGDEPVIFDDLGCLREHLAATTLPDDAVVYVADHRTGSWVNASAAVFTKTTVATPMASGIIAHADAASRDADAAARGGVPIDAQLARTGR